MIDVRDQASGNGDVPSRNRRTSHNPHRSEVLDMDCLYAHIASG